MTEDEIEDEREDETTKQSFVETWHKRPGDILEQGDVLCDISTPDFVFGMQIDDELAVMGEIHAQEGARVPDNTPICTIYHKEENENENENGN